MAGICGPQQGFATVALRPCATRGPACRLCGYAWPNLLPFRFASPASTFTAGWSGASPVWLAGRAEQTSMFRMAWPAPMLAVDEAP